MKLSSIKVNFCCFHTDKRLYIFASKDKELTSDKLKELAKSIIFSEDEKEIERIGLGVKEYKGILGRILCFVGIAFKTKDENGHNLYINKNSFCNLIGRLYKTQMIPVLAQPHMLNFKYHEEKKRNPSQEIEILHEKLEFVQRFDLKNIGQISEAMLLKF